jgi:curved DNA-binding protein
MQFKDYYKTLGVDPGASQDEIKRAYRKLARKYHPDVSSETDAEARFKEVGEAYEALKDPEKRARYDQLKNSGWHQGEEFRPPPGWSDGAGSGQGFEPEDLAGFSDFFSSLFGGGMGRGPRQRASVRRPGRDRHARIEIDLETAFHGGVRRLTMAHAELDEQGRVRQVPEQIDVRIPAGVSDGQQIRLSGKGEPGFNGGPPGDLYLEVSIKPHRLYEIHGRDLHLTLPVAPWEAALGGRIAVPTPAGKVEMNIPAGSSSGKRLRLKGRGLPGNKPGDQYVILKVVVPEARTERQRELYQALAREHDFNPRAGMEGL